MLFKSKNENSRSKMYFILYGDSECLIKTNDQIDSSGKSNLSFSPDEFLYLHSDTYLVSMYDSN